jgi:glutamyl-tRNA synthetase
MNGKYIREVLSSDELKHRLEPYLPQDFPTDQLDEILPLVLERLETLCDIEELTSFFYREITVDQADLLKKATPELVQEQLRRTTSALENLEEWSVEALEQALRLLQEQHDWKKSQYFMMVRVAVTGKKATPPLFETIHVLGKEKTLQRLTALQK